MQRRRLQRQRSKRRQSCQARFAVPCHRNQWWSLWSKGKIYIIELSNPLELCGCDNTFQWRFFLFSSLILRSPLPTRGRRHSWWSQTCPLGPPCPSPPGRRSSWARQVRRSKNGYLCQVTWRKWVPRSQCRELLQALVWNKNSNFLRAGFQEFFSQKVDIQYVHRMLNGYQTLTLARTKRKTLEDDKLVWVS